MSDHCSFSSTTSVLTLCAALAGCAAPAGPISLSVSELGSEVQEDAGSLFYGIRHRRSHNVTGLGGAETVGSISTDPDPPLLFRWPSLWSRKTLPDQMAPRISTECSRVTVQDLPMAPGKGVAEVLALRDSLDALNAAELARQRLRVQSTLANAIADSFDSAASPSSAASASEGSAPNKLTVEQRRLLVESWARFAPTSEAPTDAAGWRAVAKSLDAPLAKAEDDVQSAATRFREARREPGVIVARWEYEGSRQGGLAAVGVSATGRESQTRAGFVVMGHPRTLTLVSGDDLMWRACGSNGATCNGGAEKRTGIDSMIPSRRQYTTTFQMLARHLAWSESATFEQQQALSLQLGDVLRTLGAAGLDTLRSRLEALKVEIGYSARSSTGGENLGALTGSVTWDAPFSFWRDDAYARSVAYQRALNGPFLRVASMRSTLDAYASRYGGELPKDNRNCTGPAAVDVERARRVHLACDRLDDADFVRTVGAEGVGQRREACSQVEPTPTKLQSAGLLEPTR